MKNQPDKRQLRGLAIASVGSSIKRINKLHYRVRSQSVETKWYNVEKEYGHNIGGHVDGEWICECPDFQNRHTVCKHIFAVSLSKELRRKIVSQDVAPIVSTPSTIECEKCRSDEAVIKDGIRFNQHSTIQRYRCKNCNHRFIVNHGFEKSKANPKAVTAALDLYFKGVSLRKISDHIKQFYDIKVSAVSILKWIRKFVDVVQPYVNSIQPAHLSGIYHVDEMMVHARRENMDKGHYQWLWNLMDDTTRFWVSSIVTQRREVADARKVFKDAKTKTSKANTNAIVHDGLPSYNDAFNKEYFQSKSPRVDNIRSVSVRNRGLNSKVERLNGTMRDREKVMRGMHKAETAQKIIEAMRIHYNFCREHSTTGKTPAEQAGVKLQLDGNKIEKLIRLARTKHS